jgi:hypothetical protein
LVQSSSLNDFDSTTTMTSTGTSSTATTEASYPHLNNQRFHLFSHLHDELQINILSYVADAPLEDKDSESSTTVINTATAAAEVPVANGAPDSLSSHCLTYSATLTHVLPYVCKKFHTVYSKSDQLWKDAILRQLMQQSQPELWCDALQNIIHRTTNCTYGNVITQSSLDTAELNGDEKNHKYETVRQLIDQAYQVIAGDLRQRQSSNAGRMSYQYLYRTVLNTQLRQILPVFIMNGDVVLNEPYGLHLFEYRYRYMMLNLMRQHTNRVRQGNANYGSPTSTATRAQLLQQYPMYFVHANRGNVRRSEMAVIVQVLQCDIHPDGRADIVVKPIHFVWIERSWLYTATTNNYPVYTSSSSSSSEYASDSHHTGKSPMDTMSQPPPHNLYYAQVLKMGHKATSWMHYLQRRETLTNIMERLIASGIIVQDDDGIHRPNSDLLPVHLDIFDINPDDFDEDEDGEDDDEDIEDDGEDR